MRYKEKSKKPTTPKYLKTPKQTDKERNLLCITYQLLKKLINIIINKIKINGITIKILI